MRTAIVILNWNGRALLERFLPPLLDSVDGVNDVVMVADNGSDDGSIDMLRERFPSVPLILMDRNYGFTGGYDKALEGIDADFYLLLNSDIEVSDGWLEPLLEWMDYHPETGICAPKLHSLLERDSFEYAGAAGGLLDCYGYPFCRGRVMKRVEKDCGQYDIPEDVMWVTGACLMIRSSLWKSLGGLDDSFFAHMEEIDLCWRARLAGWKIHVVPRSTVWHLGGATLSADSPFKLKLNFRNNLFMLGKNLPYSNAVLNLFSLLSVLAESMDIIGADAFDNCLSAFNSLSREEQVIFIEASAKSACSGSARRIAWRRLLDVCSAGVYLLSGHLSFARSVFQAHREFKKNRRKVSKDELVAYLGLMMLDSSLRNARAILETSSGKCLRNRGDFALKGMYGRWIVMDSLLSGDKVFDNLRDRI